MPSLLGYYLNLSYLGEGNYPTQLQPHLFPLMFWGLEHGHLQWDHYYIYHSIRHKKLCIYLGCCLIKQHCYLHLLYLQHFNQKMLVSYCLFIIYLNKYAYTQTHTNTHTQVVDMQPLTRAAKITGSLYSHSCGISLSCLWAIISDSLYQMDYGGSNGFSYLRLDYEELGCHWRYLFSLGSFTLWEAR